MQMKTYSLTIPKPCRQGWDAMIPGDEGRYCLSCAKTVTDFSVMTDEAIQQYFLNSGGQPVCGRFKNIQLERIRIQLPGYFFKKRIAVWQKFLVIFLICFGGNFFSIDVLFGNSKALYAQTGMNGTGAKKNQQAKKKKKKKRALWLTDNTIMPYPGCETMVLGFTQTQLEELPPLPFLETYTSADNIDNHGKDDTTTTASTSGNITSNPGKKPREEKLPKQPAAFILPAIVRLRRRGSK
jgi:hypothetical protein